MVYFKTTENIDQAIEKYKGLEKTVGNDDELDFDETKISHRALILLYDTLKRHGVIEYNLMTLMRGSEVYVPPKPEPTPKSSEYLEYMEKLRVNLQEREYQTLIHNKPIDDKADEEEYTSLSQEAKVVKEQLSAIVNIILSVVSVGWAIWYWTDSSIGNLSLASRTLLSIFGSLIVLIAEVFIYTRYKMKVDDAKHVEREKEENKSVITSYEFSPKTSSQVRIDEKKKDAKDKSLRKRK